MSREKKSGRLTHFKTMPQAAGKNYRLSLNCLLIRGFSILRGALLRGSSVNFTIVIISKMSKANLL